MSLMAESRRTVAQTAARPALLRRDQHGLVGEPMPAFDRFCPQMPASERFLPAEAPGIGADLEGFGRICRGFAEDCEDSLLLGGCAAVRGGWITGMRPQ